MASAADFGDSLKSHGVAGVLFSVFLCLPDLVGADLYKWIDADGKVHYSDSAPKDVKSKRLDLKINRGPRRAHSRGR